VCSNHSIGSVFTAVVADRRFIAAVAISALSGLVRGFSGFGSALIYIRDQRGL